MCFYRKHRANVSSRIGLSKHASMKKILLLVFALGLMFTANAQKRALLIIDIQDFYFNGPNALVNPDSAAQKAALLLNDFRSKGDLVVHVKHKSKSGGGIYYRVQPTDGEKVIEKEKVNSFVGTDLDSCLKANGIQDLVICGMMTHMCVEAAFRAAADLGYKCTLVEDACATRDLTFNGGTTLAKDVHRATLSTLTYYGKVVSLDEYLVKR